MDLPKRKSVRLAGYDYSAQNYYYITICTHEKIFLFGDETERSEIGIVAEKELLDIPLHFDGVQIDKYVVMPNHIHAIIVFGSNEKAERSRPFPTLSTVVGLYKSGVSKLIHEKKPQLKIWQSSFYDEIIRNQEQYEKIWQYIETNPRKWKEDVLYR